MDRERQKHQIMIVELKELETSFRLTTCEDLLFNYKVWIYSEIVNLTQGGKSFLLLGYEEDKVQNSSEKWYHKIPLALAQQTKDSQLVLFISTELLEKVVALIDRYDDYKENYIIFPKDHQGWIGIEPYYLAVSDSKENQNEEQKLWFASGQFPQLLAG